MNKIPLTSRGAKQLRDELRRLKSERPVISATISVAREHGDLRENAEYHAAKEQQGLAEARIRDIEGKLSNAQIIEIGDLSSPEKVVFGATVHLLDIGGSSEVHYQIVGEDEANIKNGLLSVNSPIARALIGKEAGDTVEVSAPGGQRSYEIIKIEYV